MYIFDLLLFVQMKKQCSFLIQENLIGLLFGTAMLLLGHNLQAKSTLFPEDHGDSSSIFRNYSFES